MDKENFELKTKGEQKLIEEKMKLLVEVEEIRKREENLEIELTKKLEREIFKI